MPCAEAVETSIATVNTTVAVIWPIFLFLSLARNFGNFSPKDFLKQCVVLLGRESQARLRTEYELLDNCAGKISYVIDYIGIIAQDACWHCWYSSEFSGLRLKSEQRRANLPQASGLLQQPRLRGPGQVFGKHA